MNVDFYWKVKNSHFHIKIFVLIPAVFQQIKSKLYMKLKFFFK